MSGTIKIKRTEVAAWNKIISGCAIKSVGSDLFLPIIKIKASASKIITESEELIKEAAKQLDINIEVNESISEKKYLEFLSIQKNINNDEVDFDDLMILNLTQFEAFSNENPKLTAAELEFIYKWMVKEE